jgi:hypothetical protein
MKDFVTLCLTLARAILSDTQVRRQWLFYLSLAVIIFVLGGYWGLRAVAVKSAVLMGIYLLLSLAGLIFMFAFALLDFLLMRKQFREEQRRLLEDVRKPFDQDSPR